MHLEKGFTLKESNYIDFMERIHQVAKTLNWELFCETRPSVDEGLVRELYVNLTSSELIEVPVHGMEIPITLNAINEFFELLDFDNDEYSSLMSNIEPKNFWRFYSIATSGESEDLEEEEEDPTEIKPVQEAEVLDEAKPMELEAEPDVKTSMFRTQSPHPNLRNELSKFMDIMQHMQW
ncbi:hypothetical protein J1N35_037502 [Gossypium stocksii]|uniref:Uncharacterized protein n=1 Tax=Gossypium stocksii TaxID=47602 RepID=A0A9D3UKC2_9ROSI|nr:hypothetical protein J1N35_037502 [Gossypium stocksii]